MSKKDLLKALPLIAVILFLIPILTSSIHDLEQKKKDEAAYLEFVAQERARVLAERKAYLTGRFDPATRADFILIPKEYTTLPTKMYLRTETWDAFQKMRAAAAQDGVDLKIASATRNFDYQKGIWEKKWTGATLVDGKNLSVSIPDGLERFRKILEYSAAPGTSRHHWGTDVDIFYAIPEYFEGGKGKEIYDWLRLHAGEFGFCQVYDMKDAVRPAGYNEEKWHWSYLPLARIFTQEYKDLITADDFGGSAIDGTSFLGAEYASRLNLIDDYVLGINPDCL